MLDYYSLFRNLQSNCNGASVRQCPGCRSALNISMIDAVEIDCCVSCSGIWLDKGELEKLRSSKEQTEYPGTLHTILHYVTLFM